MREDTLYKLLMTDGKSDSQIQEVSSLASQKIAAGWLARLVGTDSDKSVNVALVALILLFFLQLLILLCPFLYQSFIFHTGGASNQDEYIKFSDVKDLFFNVMGAITALLGYLYGRDKGAAPPRGSEQTVGDTVVADKAVIATSAVINTKTNDAATSDEADEAGDGAKQPDD